MLRHRVVTVLMVVVAMILTAIPAGAQDMYLSKTSGRAASAWWQQVDGTPAGGEFGNFHYVSMYAFETSKGLGDMFMWVADFDCEEGETPYGEYEGGESCDWLGERLFEGFGLSFVMDKKLSSAVLTGKVTMYELIYEDDYYHYKDLGTVHANVSWAGFGNLSKNTSTWKWSDGTSTSSARYASTDRQATLAGHVGEFEINSTMSSGYMSMYRDMYKSRSK